MAQADTTRVDNGTGQLVREGLNDGVEAALTNSAGETPPPVTIPNLWWWDPSGVLGIRNAENIAWRNYWSFERLDAPGAQNNEAAGYPVGAYWSTLAGQAYVHRGGGIWFEVGSGTGGGGSGGGMFLNFLGVMWLVDDEAQPALGIDTSGIMWLVEDGT